MYQQLLDRIGQAESGNNYNIAFGGARLPQNATVGQILDFQRQHIGRTGSSAVGRYQIINKTMKGLVDEMGLSHDTPFTPALQDAMAMRLLKRRGLDAYMQGKLSPEAFGHNLSQEWAVLPAGPNNLSYYHGDEAGNVATVKWDDLMNTIGGDPSVVASHGPLSRTMNHAQGDPGAIERHAGVDGSMAAAQGLDPQGAYGQVPPGQVSPDAPIGDVYSPMYNHYMDLLDQLTQKKELSPLTILLGAGAGAALGGGWKGALAGAAGTIQAHQARQPSRAMQIELARLGIDISRVQGDREDRRLKREQAEAAKRVMGHDDYVYYQTTGKTPNERRLKELEIAAKEGEMAAAREAANAPPIDYGTALDGLAPDIRRLVDLNVYTVKEAFDQQDKRDRYVNDTANKLRENFNKAVASPLTVLGYTNKIARIPYAAIMDPKNKTIDQELLTIWNKLLRPDEAMMVDDVKVAMNAARGMFEDFAMRVANGQTLSPEERIQYLGRIEQIARAAEKGYHKIKEQWGLEVDRTNHVTRERVFISDPPKFVEFEALKPIRERRKEREKEEKLQGAHKSATERAAKAGNASEKPGFWSNFGQGFSEGLSTIFGG